MYSLAARLDRILLQHLQHLQGGQRVPPQHTALTAQKALAQSSRGFVQIMTYRAASGGTRKLLLFFVFLRLCVSVVNFVT